MLFYSILALASHIGFTAAFGGFSHPRTLVPSSAKLFYAASPSRSKNSIESFETDSRSQNNCFSLEGAPLIASCRAPSSVALNASPLAASLPAVFSAVNTFYKTMPLASAFVTCGIKASAADLVAPKTQITLESEVAEVEAIRIEKRRNLAFFLYGGFYQGMAQQIIFNKIFPRLFGESTDFTTVAYKVLTSQLVVGPLITLPVAYLMKSLIFKHSFTEALSFYKNDVKDRGLLKKFWSLWVPVQCLTFGVVPQHLRILFIAAVSFFWLVIFSSITAEDHK